VLDLQQVLRDALSMRGRAGVPEAQELPQDKLCTFDAAREHHAGDHQKCRQELYIKVLECSETQGLGTSVQRWEEFSLFQCLSRLLRPLRA